MTEWLFAAFNDFKIWVLVSKLQGICVVLLMEYSS